LLSRSVTQQGAQRHSTNHPRIRPRFIRSIVSTGNYQDFSDANLPGFGLKVIPRGGTAYTIESSSATQWRSAIDGRSARTNLPTGAASHAPNYLENEIHIKRTRFSKWRILDQISLNA
jgi:hypothetical protein